MKAPEFWKVTYKVKTANGREWKQTVRHLEGPQRKAVRRGRAIVRGMFPSCTIRKTNALRDRQWEAQQARGTA